MQFKTKCDETSERKLKPVALIRKEINKAKGKSAKTLNNESNVEIKNFNQYETRTDLQY